jgi:CheY-like chemotaxis protein
VSSADLRVLIVDDDHDTVDAMALFLGSLGYQPIPAYDGRHALALAQSCCPQVIILDLAMPGCDGYRVARALRELPAAEDAVIIMVTGYGREEDRQQAFAAGCDHFFVKPVDDWTQFVGLIERAAK